MATDDARRGGQAEPTGDDLYAVAQRYQDALESFIDRLRGDPNIIAVHLLGSLAYDKVWHKSDMDLTVVVRDQKLERKGYCIDEDRVLLNISVMTRTEYRNMLQRSKGGGFSHSMFARARLVYSTDDSLYELLEDAQCIGTDDAELVVFGMIGDLIGLMEKIEKWLVVKRNPMYAQYYILRAAGLLADIYLVEHGIAPNRESVLRVMELDPEFLRPYYERPMSGPMTEDEVYRAMERMTAYIEGHLGMLSRLALDYLEDGEVRTASMLTERFGYTAFGVFDFLAQRGIVERVTQTIRITPKGRQNVEEAAFFYAGGAF